MSGQIAAGGSRPRLGEQVLLGADQHPALDKPLDLRRVLLMVSGAISRSIASHTCRARSGASAAANTAVICR
ncbi:hypothetical protein [Streptomyces sp. NPDC004546]|uniref:hypothetical protein n=1 Tax=unclassified Streptomyces TaxID=2593676 RepID=UPI0033AB4204